MRYLYSQKPEIAKEFAEHTSKEQMKKLSAKKRIKTMVARKKNV
jgi:hypothetical protein